MDLSSTSSSASATDVSSLSAKLKRLKIEESLLLQSINKCKRESSQTDIEVDATSHLTFLEFNTFSKKTQESFRQIKLIFQDIKTNLSSKEMLKALDINDVKRSTLELEHNIKSFKLYLQSELARLKSAEHQLNRTLNENPVIINKIKMHPKIQTAKYNEIVPSPVKTLMTSPFKCSEVQHFQEFMMNSANRYGGWNEYHHNIFVNCWQKHFASEINISLDEVESSVKNSPTFLSFLRDVLQKLQDVSEDEIISHIQWYSKYIYLKERQQNAIDKWRSNRKVMRSAKVASEEKKGCKIKIKNNKQKGFSNNSDNNSVDDQYNMENLILQYPSQDEACSFTRNYKRLQQQNKKPNDTYSANILNNSRNKIAMNFGDHSNSDNQNELRFIKPTKKWNSRVNSKNNKTETIHNNIEDIVKL